MIPLTPDTPFLVPLGVLCVFLGGLIITTWRLANFVRTLCDELRHTWTFRDQEHWALELERRNRAIGVFVPDVKRAPKPEHAS